MADQDEQERQEALQQQQEQQQPPREETSVADTPETERVFVQHVYDSIADHFSRTRYAVCPPEPSGTTTNNNTNSSTH